MIRPTIKAFDQCDVLKLFDENQNINYLCQDIFGEVTGHSNIPKVSTKFMGCWESEGMIFLGLYRILKEYQGRFEEVCFQRKEMGQNEKD